MRTVKYLVVLLAIGIVAYAAGVALRAYVFAALWSMHLVEIFGVEPGIVECAALVIVVSLLMPGDVGAATKRDAIAKAVGAKEPASDIWAKLIGAIILAPLMALALGYLLTFI